MKILYLHGLGSSPFNQKVRDLEQAGHQVLAPHLDYRQPDVWFNLSRSVYNFKPELIIGSSMGGYMGYILASQLNVPAILFNPALVLRSFEPIKSKYQACIPDEPANTTGQYKPELKIYSGLFDTTIPWFVNFFKLLSYGNYNFCFYNGGHSVPYQKFKAIMQKESVLNKQT